MLLFAILPRERADGNFALRHGPLGILLVSAGAITHSLVAFVLNPRERFNRRSRRGRHDKL